MDGTYYVADELPEDNLPASITMANTWYLPRNSQAMDPLATGVDSWKRYVYEGTTPDPLSLTARSRIELSVAGSTHVDNKTIEYNRQHGSKIIANHLTFYNRDKYNTLITSVRSCDARNTLSPTKSWSTTKIGSNGTRWEREFDDNSTVVFVYNPDNIDVNINGTLRNGRVIIVHQDINGVVTGREFTKNAGGDNVQISF